MQSLFHFISFLFVFYYAESQMERTKEMSWAVCVVARREN